MAFSFTFVVIQMECGGAHTEVLANAILSETRTDGGRRNVLPFQQIHEQQLRLGASAQGYALFQIFQWWWWFR